MPSVSPQPPKTVDLESIVDIPVSIDDEKFSCGDNMQHSAS